MTRFPEIRKQNLRMFALLLVGLSVLLTMIGGIIPSQKASRSDPVAALRSE